MSANGRLSVVLCAVVFLFSSIGSARSWAPRIAGFENPKELAEVMAGKILVSEETSHAMELHLVSRGFFNKVSADSYVKLGTNHAYFPSLFPEITSGKTLSTNAASTEFTYGLDMVFKVGFLSKTVYVEGKQTIFPAADPKQETKMNNETTNQKAQLKSSLQTTRLIPYSGGILVEDRVDIVFDPKASNLKLVKQKLRDFYSQQLSIFREELGGE